MHCQLMTSPRRSKPEASALSFRDRLARAVASSPSFSTSVSRLLAADDCISTLCRLLGFTFCLGVRA